MGLQHIPRLVLGQASDIQAAGDPYRTYCELFRDLLVPTAHDHTLGLLQMRASVRSQGT